MLPSCLLTNGINTVLSPPSRSHLPSPATATIGTTRVTNPARETRPQLAPAPLYHAGSASSSSSTILSWANRPARLTDGATSYHRREDATMRGRSRALCSAGRTARLPHYRVITMDGADQTAGARRVVYGDGQSTRPPTRPCGNTWNPSTLTPCSAAGGSYRWCSWAATPRPPMSMRLRLTPCITP